MSDVFTELGRRIRRVARAEAHDVAEPVSRWKVIGTSPLRLQADSGDVLEEGEDDFEVGSISDAEMGDVVLVGIDSDGDYVGLGVLAASSGTTGPAALKARVTSLEGRATALEARDLAGMVKIADAVVTSAALTFAVIPQTFSHLRMYVVGQSNRAGVASTGMRVRVNGSVVNYAFSYDIWNNGAHAEAQAGTQTSGYIGNAPAANRGNDNYTTDHIVEFPWYSNATSLKTFSAQASGYAGDGGVLLMGDTYNIWEAAQAITSIVVTDDAFGALGPRAKATLYGIR